MPTFEGKLVADGLQFGVVVSRFNEFITNKLLSGCLDSLTRHGADTEKVDIAWVPGAFEIPLIAQQMARSGKYDAVICLGAVIRGATPHFDMIAAEMTKGIAMAGLTSNVPVIYGVITSDNIEQAVERAGTKMGNKGFDAANSAIEMANLINTLQHS